jgi:hypothetical protein
LIIICCLPLPFDLVPPLPAKITFFSPETITKEVQLGNPSGLGISIPY